jgi:hypothetical protein
MSEPAMQKIELPELGLALTVSLVTRGPDLADDLHREATVLKKGWRLGWGDRKTGACQGVHAYLGCLLFARHVVPPGKVPAVWRTIRRFDG